MYWADKNTAGFLFHCNPASIKTPDGIYCYLFPTATPDVFTEVIGEWHNSPNGEMNFLIRSWTNSKVMKEAAA